MESKRSNNNLSNQQIIFNEFNCQYYSKVKLLGMKSRWLRSISSNQEFKI
jgi:hypothetical protein